MVTDITEQKKALEELAQRERELREKAAELADMNAALKILLNQRDRDKTDLEEKVVSNAKDLIQPYIDQLKAPTPDSKKRLLLDILEINL